MSLPTVQLEIHEPLCMVFEQTSLLAFLQCLFEYLIVKYYCILSLGTRSRLRLILFYFIALFSQSNFLYNYLDKLTKTCYCSTLIY